MNQTIFVNGVEHKQFDPRQWGHLQNGEEFTDNGIKYRVKGLNYSSSDDPQLLCECLGAAVQGGGQLTNQQVNQLANQPVNQPVPNQTTTTTYNQANNYYQNNRVRERVEFPGGGAVEREYPMGYQPGQMPNPWGPGGPRGQGGPHRQNQPAGLPYHH